MLRSLALCCSLALPWSGTRALPSLSATQQRCRTRAAVWLLYEVRDLRAQSMPVRGASLRCVRPERWVQRASISHLVPGDPKPLDHKHEPQCAAGGRRRGAPVDASLSPCGETPAGGLFGGWLGRMSRVVDRLGLTRRGVVLSVAGLQCSSAAQASVAATQAEVAYAIGDLFACQAAVRTISNLVRYEAWEDAAPLMTRPPISSFGVAAATVVGDLNDEQRDLADAATVVLSRLHELAAAIEAQDRARAMAATREASSALIPIIAACQLMG
mgnify:CR=1 FL=1